MKEASRELRALEVACTSHDLAKSMLPYLPKGEVQDRMAKQVNDVAERLIPLVRRAVGEDSAH